MTIKEQYTPKVEGLQVIEQTRNISAYDCILAKDELDKNDPGYQAPKPAEEQATSDLHKRKHNANTAKDKRESV